MNKQRRKTVRWLDIQSPPNRLPEINLYAGRWSNDAGTLKFLNKKDFDKFVDALVAMRGQRRTP